MSKLLDGINRSKERLFNGEITHIHIELSSQCNLACYQCKRTKRIENNINFNETQISLEDFKSLIPENILKNKLVGIAFCGNYGDPLMAKDFLPIFKYCKEINPNIILQVHTNGSLRNVKYWKEIASISNKNDIVIFGIDGLADTNHLYRVNSNYKKIIENAKAYIDNGGIAQWDCLLFEHNKHQIKEIEQLARDIGFSRIYFKITSRAFNEQIIHLKPVFKEKKNEDNISKTVICQSIKNKSIYISAEKIYLPCFCISYQKKDDPLQYVNINNKSVLSENVIKNLGFEPNTKICSDSCSISPKNIKYSYNRVNINFKK